jgi:hypothetical protein
MILIGLILPCAGERAEEYRHAAFTESETTEHIVLCGTSVIQKILVDLGVPCAEERVPEYRHETNQAIPAAEQIILCFVQESAPPTPRRTHQEAIP